MEKKYKNKLDKIVKEIEELMDSVDDLDSKAEVINTIRDKLHRLSPFSVNPVDFVRWIRYEKVKPNDYNPNIVANTEMELLYKSVYEDGYTQPVVAFYDDDKDEYTIVDGFHRYSLMRLYKDIYNRNKGFLPVVVIEKDINERMASTIRHNRARGKHQVVSMAKIVFDMLKNGWSDEEICNRLGMEPEELIRLKHISGFSKLFEKVPYNKAWKTTNMVKLEKEWKEKHKNEKGFEYE